MQNDEWLTVNQAAELSGYNDQYIGRLIRAGKLKARKFGPVWQVSKTALFAYLQAAEASEDQRRGPRGD